MASALEHFVTAVRSLSSQASYRALYDYVSKAGENLSKNSQHLDNVLETLNFQQHSLGVLAVLIVKFSTAPSTTPEARLRLAKEFLTTCNGEQIRLAPDMFAEFCHLFTQHLLEQKQPIMGILLLKKAIAKLQLHDAQLTAIHADLCQLCLLAKNFKPALEILDIDITSICEETPQDINQHFDSKYFLLYFYYGGMIYLALRNLERALYFFEVAITTPARAVSHIMLEAYKKYVLVSLLLNGKLDVVPKYTAKVIERFIKPLSTPYYELAVAFSENNTAQLNTAVNKHEEVYNRDQNMGLVKQVVKALYKKNIQRLTKTFLTLSLSDVASRVGLQTPADAEAYILRMIDDGEIYASINQKDGMVVFKDQPEKYCGPEVLKNLEAQLAHCMELDRQVLAMDEEIQVNPQYVKKMNGMLEDEATKNAYVM